MPKFVLGQLGPYSETISKNITKQTKKKITQQKYDLFKQTKTDIFTFRINYSWNSLLEKKVRSYITIFLYMYFSESFEFQVDLSLRF